MYFLVFTNGTRIDENLADELARLGNVAPAISLEGFETETDRRRGPGLFARVMKTMALLRERGVLFGIRVTYASHTLDTVTATNSNP
jgi:MoaA/NifB/PqqE/SkfB family radical SAM enzyme